MDQHQGRSRRRRRRRRGSRFGRELSGWLTLLFLACRKIWSWAWWIIMVAFVLAVGLAFPALMEHLHG